MSRWKCTKVHGANATTKKDPYGNTIIETTANVVVYHRLSVHYDLPCTGVEHMLMIYESKVGWVAHLGQADVSDQLGQDRLRDLHAIANAVLAFTGTVDKVPLQELPL